MVPNLYFLLTPGVNSMLKQLINDLELFAYKLSVSYNKPIVFPNQWKCLVTNKFQNTLKNN